MPNLPMFGNGSSRLDHKELVGTVLTGLIMGENQALIKYYPNFS